jgi:DNA-binding MarR family transcriptional regulator
MSVITYNIVSIMKDTLNAGEIETACVCLGVRRAARLVARRYDEALRPLGLTSGQFSILAALLRDRPAPLGALADVLGLERTTLNRNLKPLEAVGLIMTMPDGADARVRRLSLTPAGRAMLDRAIPLWQGAQADSQRRMGEAGWSDLRLQLRALW